MNDSPAQANRLTAGTVLNGRVGGSSDRLDCYRVVVESTASVRIEVTNQNAADLPGVIGFDVERANRTKIGNGHINIQNAARGSPTKTVTALLEAGESYYAIVRGDSQLVEYSIAMSVDND